MSNKYKMIGISVVVIVFIALVAIKFNSATTSENSDKISKEKTMKNLDTKQQSHTLATGTYQHYKGNYYQVLGLSRHSETLEVLVVYKALYGDFGLWVRPVSMFEEKIDFEGKTVPRFKMINQNHNPPSLR